MKLDKDEELIKKALNSINIKESNIKFNINKKLSKRKNIFNFKRIAVTFSILLSLVVVVPVMAATIPSFQGLLDRIDSRFEGLLKPVQLISQDKGIKMEVVAALKDEDMIALYITLQDVEGNRIDKTLDLNDSYRIKGLSAYTSEVVDYNEKNKTATIRVQANGNEDLNNKKVEFSLGSFISGEKNISSSLNGNVFVDKLRNKVKGTAKLNISNISGTGGTLYNGIDNEKEISILEKGTLNIGFKGISSMSITNMGIIDNQLHIQTKWDKVKYNNHGLLYLTNKEGKKINVKSGSISLGFDKNGEASYGNDYIEYIFDLENIDLNNVNLNANVSYSEGYVEGQWKTNFKIDKVSETKVINYKGSNFDKVKISPIGITISADDNLDEVSSIKINMGNGVQETLESKIIIDEGNKAAIKFLSKSPINIKDVKSIDINENIVVVN